MLAAFRVARHRLRRPAHVRLSAEEAGIATGSGVDAVVGVVGDGD